MGFSLNSILSSAGNTFETDEDKQDAKTRALYALLGSQDTMDNYGGFGPQHGAFDYTQFSPQERYRKKMAPMRLRMAASKGGFGPQGMGGAGFGGF